MLGLKSAILAIFQQGQVWPCPVSAAIKNLSQELKNSFCFGFLWIFRKIERQNWRAPIFLRFKSFHLGIYKVRNTFTESHKNLWGLPSQDIHHIRYKTTWGKYFLSTDIYQTWYTAVGRSKNPEGRGWGTSSIPTKAFWRRRFYFTPAKNWGGVRPYPSPPIFKTFQSLFCL